MKIGKSWLWKVGIGVLAMAGYIFAQTASADKAPVVLSTVSVAADAYEPDNDCAAAKPLTLGTAQDHTLHVAEDVDWMTVALTTNKYYTFITTNITVDTVLYLVATNGCTQLDVNDDWGNGTDVNAKFESRIDLDMNTDGLPTGTYYLYVRSYHTNCGTGAYTILAKESEFSPDSYEYGTNGVPEDADNTWTAITNVATLAVSQSHTIHNNTDVDYVNISATSGHVYQVVVTNISTTSAADFPMDLTVSVSNNLWGWPWLSTLMSRTASTNMNVMVLADANQTMLAKMNTGAGAGSQCKYTFIVNDLGTGGGDAYEPDNDTSTNNTLLVAETPQSHTIYPDNDLDWMKFPVEANHFYRVSLNGNNDLMVQLNYTTNTANLDDLANVVTVNGGADYMWTTAGVCYVQVYMPNYDYTTNTPYSVVLHDFGSVVASDIYEPDNAYTNASTLAVDASQSHTYHSETDVDWVKFTATAGSYYYIRTTNTVGRVQPRVQLYGTNGTALVSTGTLENNGYTLYFRCTAAGTYYLKTQDWNWGGAGQRMGAYILSIDNMGAATDIYEPDDSAHKANQIDPAVAQYHVLDAAGDIQDWLMFTAVSNHYYTVSVTNRTGDLEEDASTLTTVMYGTNGTTWITSANDPTETSPLYYRPTVSGVYYIKVSSAQAGGYQILLSDKGNPADAYEVDNDYTRANTLTAGTAQSHTMPDYAGSVYDQDWVKFDVVLGHNYRLDAFWQDSVIYGYVTLTLYDSRGITAMRQSSEDGYSNRVSLEFTPTASGTLYARTKGLIGWASYSFLLTDLGATGGDGTHTGEYEAMANPAVGPDGTLFVPWRYYQYDGIYAYYLGCHRPDGTTDFLRFSSEISESPVVGLDGSVYVYCSDGNLFKMTGDKAGTVSQIWNLPGCSVPALGLDNTLYISCTTNRVITNVVNGVTNLATEQFGKLFAINSSGAIAQEWNTDPMTAISSPVVDRHGQVYVVTYLQTAVTNITTNIYTDTATTTITPDYPGALSAYNVSNTAVLWTQSVTRGRSVIVGDDCTVYVTSTNKVYTFTEAGAAGTTIALNNGGSLAVFPALSSDRLYVGFSGATNGAPTNGLAIFKLDGTVDRLIGTDDVYDNAGVSVSPALCANGTIYAAAGKRLNAFDSSGATLWTSYAENTLSSPLLAPDGTIYIRAYSHIYAIYGGLVPAETGWPMVNHDPRNTSCSGATVIPAAQQAAANASEALVKDYDGDGFADLVSYDSATYTWTFRKSSTDFSVTTLVFGMPGFVPLAGDLFGDGKAVPALYSEATGNWYFSVAGGTTIGPFQLFGAATPGYSGMLEDVDGDHKADPVIYSEAAGLWYFKLSSANYYQVGPLDMFGGLTGWRGFMADVDGDHKADPIIYNDTLGYWFLRLSLYYYAPVGPLNLFSGLSGRVSMSDMDGDHRADPVIYIESSGKWYIRMSSMGYATLLGPALFGGSGYKSFAADVDGDGKGDLGLLETATGQWQVRGSASFYSLRTW